MMNMKQMLGESGRTISNKDMGIIDMMNRNTDPVSPPARMPLPDNEPRMGDRSPANQMFSIDTAISNLMNEYDMVVRNNEFERAQMIANQIDQLQQQKIAIQSQNDPVMLQKGPMTDLSGKIGPMIGTLQSINLREMMGESGKTISNQDREAISGLLESISE